LQTDATAIKQNSPLGEAGMMRNGAGLCERSGLRKLVIGSMLLTLVWVGWPPTNAFAQKEPVPFKRRFDVPELPEGLAWSNTDKPVKLKDLKGKFVLLDFWTYCCINCIQTLPELKKLEKAYPNELVVIGVHSGKFDGEKDAQNIADAVLREGIEHPVVNDAEQQIWTSFGVSSWPTVILIDPEGKAVWGKPGETKFETVDAILKEAIPYYDQEKLLDRKPIKWSLLEDKREATPLKFPGKVLADGALKRLFITDTKHNRIVIAGLDGKLIDVIGSGKEGREDGAYGAASFKKPQGVAVLGSTLYIADTENHLIRKADLEAKTVTTIAGTGAQQPHAFPFAGVTPQTINNRIPLPDKLAGEAVTTPLASPWALQIHDEYLYIAMAGPHQIWRMPLKENIVEFYAGSAAEDIVDGNLVPKIAYGVGSSAFAQPSGLATDGKALFVVDSEGASIRSVPLDGVGKVKTVVGTNKQPDRTRLFVFGDVDGPAAKAKFQHPTCIAFADGVLYVADTYNNKIRTIDPKSGATKTLAGGGQKEHETLDEPMGVSVLDGKVYVADTNKHRIRVIDLSTKQVSTLEISGLTPPAK
jgi:thiol-disulfide isomerase/thioredoxin